MAKFFDFFAPDLLASLAAVGAALPKGQVKGLQAGAELQTKAIDQKLAVLKALKEQLQLSGPKWHFTGGTAIPEYPGGRLGAPVSLPGKPGRVKSILEEASEFMTPEQFQKWRQKYFAHLGGDKTPSPIELINILQNDPDPARRQWAKNLLDEMQKRKVSLMEAEEPSKLRIVEAGAMARGKAFGAGRYGTYLDTTQGNRPVQMPFGDYTQAEQRQPGRYLPASPGERALNKTALIEEIRGAANDLMVTLDKMPELTATQALQIAMAIRSNNPRGAWGSLVSRGFAETLSPEQIDYVTALLSLRESSFALRTVLGAGQGSDLLREAIAQTVPSMMTPSKAYARRQIETLRVQIDRLERGIPTVPLRPEPQPPAPTGTPAGSTARSPLKTMDDFKKRFGWP